MKTGQAAFFKQLPVLFFPSVSDYRCALKLNKQIQSISPLKLPHKNLIILAIKRKNVKELQTTQPNQFS
jgi:hypothetical protein